MYATIPCCSREKPTQWRSTTKVRSWTVLPRINKVLHTDSLSVESTDVKPGTKPDTTAGIYGKKASRNLIGNMSQWRVQPCTDQDKRERKKNQRVILLKQLPLQHFSSEENRKFKTICRLQEIKIAVSNLNTKCYDLELTITELQ